MRNIYTTNSNFSSFAVIKSYKHGSIAICDAGRHMNLKEYVCTHSNEISIHRGRNSFRTRVICKAHVISHYITVRCTARLVLIPHLYHLHHFHHIHLFRETRRAVRNETERIAKYPNYQPTPISIGTGESAFFYR